MNIRMLFIVLICFMFASSLSVQDTRLVRQPDISSTHIVFAYANDIWLTGTRHGPPMENILPGSPIEMESTA